VQPEIKLLHLWFETIQKSGRSMVGSGRVFFVGSTGHFLSLALDPFIGLLWFSNKAQIQCFCK